MIAEYLTEAPYRFTIAFGRGKFEDFWGATEGNARILAERKKWLEEDEGKYLAVLPEAGQLLEEAVELGFEAGTLPNDQIPNAKYQGMTKPDESPDEGEARDGAEDAQTGLSALHGRFLGENWEPDWLVLKREAEAVRLVAGCVCFPSSWALEEKIGKPIEQIHEVVPALNANVGKQIATFLERIKPGVSWTRNNWGLSRSPEWNQHPTRGTPRLDDTVGLDEIFFRVEEQSLVALPRTSGVLFGIRLKVIPLAGYAKTTEGLKLAELLESMPEPMAQYKGLSRARRRIIDLLRE